MEISKLKDLVKKKRITQNELADIVGVTRQTIGNLLESGDFRVSHLEKIAEALNVEIGYFFSDGSQIDISGQVQIGHGNKQNVGERNKDLQTKVELQKKEIEGLKKEVELLRELNEVLKNK